MTIRDNQNKLLALIREGLEYNEPSNNKVELLEDALISAGLSKQQITLGLKKLAREGVIELQQIFFAPDRTVSNYENETKYKVPPDDFYKNPVYVLHISREKLKSLPSISAAKFIDDEGTIYFGTTKIELPPNRGEHSFCKVMFDYPTNHSVSWDVIYEKTTGEESSDKRSKRKVYDICEALNKRIKKATGVDNMFVWQGTTIKRTR